MKPSLRSESLRSKKKVSSVLKRKKVRTAALEEEMSKEMSVVRKKKKTHSEINPEKKQSGCLRAIGRLKEGNSFI